MSYMYSWVEIEPQCKAEWRMHSCRHDVIIRVPVELRCGSCVSVLCRNAVS